MNDVMTDQQLYQVEASLSLSLFRYSSVCVAILACSPAFSF